MIARLRARHRLWLRLLAVVVPAAFLVALFSARSVPRLAELPGALTGVPSGSGDVHWVRRDLFSELPVDVRRFDAAIELSPRRDARRPDLLVYWSDETVETAGLPERAYLLGRLSSTTTRRFELPAAARGAAGRLFLYSLGHQELVDSTVLPE